MQSPLEQDLKHALETRGDLCPVSGHEPHVEKQLQRRARNRQVATAASSLAVLVLGLSGLTMAHEHRQRGESVATASQTPRATDATADSLAKPSKNGSAGNPTSTAEGNAETGRSLVEPTTVGASSWTVLPSAGLRLSPEKQQTLHYAQIIAGVNCLKSRGMKNLHATKPDLGANHLLLGEYFRPPLGPEANTAASIVGPAPEDRTQAMSRLYLGASQDKDVLSSWLFNFTPPQRHGETRPNTPCQDVAQSALFTDAKAQKEFEALSVQLRGFAFLPAAQEGISAAWRTIRHSLTDCMNSANVLSPSALSNGSEKAYNRYIQEDPKRRAWDIKCKKERGLYSKYYTVVAAYERVQAEHLSAEITRYISLLAVSEQKARDIIKEYEAKS